MEAIAGGSWAVKSALSCAGRGEGCWVWGLEAPLKAMVSGSSRWADSAKPRTPWSPPILGSPPPAFPIRLARLGIPVRGQGQLCQVFGIDHSARDRYMWRASTRLVIHLLNTYYQPPVFSAAWILCAEVHAPDKRLNDCCRLLYDGGGSP